MVTLTLDRVWVNLLSTGQSVGAWSVPGREETYEVPGQARVYAGGRRRSVTAAGEIGTFRFGLRLLSRTDVETLRTWAGQTVQVRDHKGRRFFGVYYGIAIAEHKAESTWDVGISLNVVTATEGV